MSGDKSFYTGRRYASVWFRHLMTDWFALQQPELHKVPFVLRTPVHGRMIITAVNTRAEQQGIRTGMALADARAVFRNLEVRDNQPDVPEKLLRKLAEWCVRFTPVAAIDPPDGLLLDISGCAHLWGGEEQYLQHIIAKLTARGYDVGGAIADTPGVAWGLARFAKSPAIAPPGENLQALLPLPPEALRLEKDTIARLHKLGLHRVEQFIHMPRASLRRRFGQHLLTRLDMALGHEMEWLEPVQLPEPYEERLPCLEPVLTRPGIEIALRELLTRLCLRLLHEQKGLRMAMFAGHRVDGKKIQIDIGTHRPSHHVDHLFRLFELKLSTLAPGMGIELFTLHAPKVEDYLPAQQKMWEKGGGLSDTRLSELIDRIAARTGMQNIHRYLPAEHHWPERSLKPATSLQEQPATMWRTDKLRPLLLMPKPERIEVTAPIPDYPPMLFRYKGKVHKITKADGPERIEQEWWIRSGRHRDYYCVEDESGNRYWIFRSGHYDEEYEWYLHGVFS